MSGSHREVSTWASIWPLCGTSVTTRLIRTGLVTGAVQALVPGPADLAGLGHPLVAQEVERHREGSFVSGGSCGWRRIGTAERLSL